MFSYKPLIVHRSLVWLVVETQNRQLLSQPKSTKKHRPLFVRFDSDLHLNTKIVITLSAFLSLQGFPRLYKSGPPLYYWAAIPVKNLKALVFFTPIPSC